MDINEDALGKILREDAAPLVAQIADRIARSVETLAGSVSGVPVRVTRDDGVGDARARSAVIATHPTDKGRQAARDALAQALQISGG